MSDPQPLPGIPDAPPAPPPDDRGGCLPVGFAVGLLVVLALRA